MQTTLSLTTDEVAICRYSPVAGVAYGSMTNTFTTTGSTAHSTVITGLTTGNSYNFYVRCADAAANANPDDFVIAFSVAIGTAATSNFSGIETPLSEGGTWDSPGVWADLRKNNGAFAVGLNAQARLVTPARAADQYSEITYDQNPGSSSWVGITTRMQGATNGSGYLAIAYGGEIRLYRADDTGTLSFTLLASVAVDVLLDAAAAAVQRFNHNAGGTVYSSGQPGIAASVFGGPQVKILSFEAGDIGG